MAGGDAFAKLLEKTMGERAASSMAVRAGQVGAQILRRQESTDPREDTGFALVDLTPEQESRAARSWIYSHRPLAEKPELFYGPFPQLGTKLGLGPPAVQFVVDMVTDPFTYVGLGTGGLLAKATKGAVGMNLAARTARLTAALGKGAAAIGGAEVIDEVGRALEAAGRILGSGKREALLQAARTGDKAFGGLIDEAMKVGKMEPEIEASLTAMKKDRKSLAWLLDNSEEVLGFEKVPAYLTPQKTIASKIAVGQAEPFVKFGIPSTNPVNLARQLVGIGYQGEKFYTPMAKSIMAKGLRELSGPPAGILSGSAKGYQGLRRFAERPYEVGDITVTDLDFTLNHMEAALGSPMDRPNIQAAEEIPIDAAAIDKVWKSLPKEARRTINKDQWASKVVGQLRRQTMDLDKRRLNLRQSVMDELAGAAEQAQQPFGPPAPGGVGAELAQRGEVAASQVRRFGDMFGVTNLIREGSARDFHLTLSSNLRQITQWSSFVSGQGRDILIRNVGGIAQADEVDAVLRYVRELPEAWTKKVVEGKERLFLKPEAVKPGSLFADRLSLSQGDSLRIYLTQQGLPSEVSQMAERIGQSLDMIGANLKDEKAIAGFLDAYWPAVFERNSAFGRRFGEGAEGWSALTNKVLYDPDTLADLAPDLVADMNRLTGKAAGTKLSVQQVRKVADDMRAALEKAGYGRYTSSSLASFGRAMDAYGKALFERRLFDEFGSLAGHSPYEDLAPNLKKLVTRDAWDAVDKDGISKVRDIYGDGSAPPESIRAAYMSIKLRSGRPKLISDFDKAQTAAEILVNDVEDMAKEALSKTETFGGRSVDVSAPEDLQSFKTEQALGMRREFRDQAALKEFEKASLTASEKVAIQRREIDIIRKVARRRPQDLELQKTAAAEIAEKLGLTKELKAAEEALGKSVPEFHEIAKSNVASRLAGKRQIKTEAGKVIRIRTAKIRTDLPGHIEGTFDADWLTHGYPEHLRYAKEIETEVKRRVSKEIAGLYEDLSHKQIQLRNAFTKQREADVGAAAKAVGEAKRLAGKAAKEIGEREAGRAPERATIWVRKDLANHFIEPLSLWEQQGLNKASMQALGKLNSNLKGAVLLGDVFHLHSLTMNQIVGAGPANLFKMLVDPNGNLLPGVKAGAFAETAQFARMRQQAALAAGVGAAAGAATGAGFEGDATDIATLSLTGAVYGAALGAARLNAAWGKRLSLSPDGFEFLHWMGRGGWTGRPDDRSIGMFSRWMKNLRDDIMRKHPDSMLVSPIDGLRHVNDVWEQELWSTAHNGGKHWLFSTVWNDEVAKLEKGAAWNAMKPVAQEQAKEALARQVMDFTNSALGGQNVAALLNQPSWMHYARWGLLAPDWTASRIRMASGFFHGLDPISQAAVGAVAGTAVEAAEAGFDPEEMTGMGIVGGAGLGVLAGRWSQRIAGRLMTAGDVTARRARKAAATALLAGFGVANLLNKALSGHYLWENEEGKKTSIELPGRTETGRKRYLSFGKQWLEAFEFAAISEKEGFAVPVAGRLASKLSVPARWSMQLLMNDNGFAPIVTADENVLERIGHLAAFSAQSATPILIQGPLRLGAAALQGQADLGGATEAAVRFAGLPLSRSARPMSSPLDAGAFMNAIRPTQPSGVLISPDQTMLEQAFR